MGGGESSSLPGRAHPFAIGHVDFHFTRESFLPISERIVVTHDKWIPLEVPHIPSQHPEHPEDTTVPTAARRWEERTKAWTESITGVADQTHKDYREHLKGLAQQWVTLGFELPGGAKSVTSEMVEAYKRDNTLAPATRTKNLGLLRMFLGHEGSALAKDENLWRKKPGRRPMKELKWPTGNEMKALLKVANGYDQVLVSILGYQGLRSMELRTLQVRNCLMSMPDPHLAFVGKGNKPRKPSVILEPTYPILLPLVKGRQPTDRIYPFGRTTISRHQTDLCKKAGTRLFTPHDLRRGFARLCYYAGVSVYAIKEMMGHSRIEQTLAYIGTSELEMRSGIDKLQEYMGSTLSTPLQSPTTPPPVVTTTQSPGRTVV